MELDLEVDFGGHFILALPFVFLVITDIWDLCLGVRIGIQAARMIDIRQSGIL